MSPRYKIHKYFDLPQREMIVAYHDILNDAAKKGEGALKQAKREFCQQDLYFLLTYPLLRVDMHNPWLFDRCREVQAAPDGMLDLWSREHYKSTIITYGHSILDILNDPEVTIGLFSHTKDISAAFLKSIKLTLETNTHLKYLFPDILYNRPQVQSPMWSDKDGIVVRRQSIRKEPTVSAWGVVQGMPISMHFKIRVYDDMVTDKSVTTPDMIKKTTDSWALSINLGTEHGVDRVIGTPYHLHDTYSVMEERGRKVRRHPCTSDGTDDLRKTVFRSQEYLSKMRAEQGIYVFSCQMLLNPLADRVQGMKEEWLQFWPNTSDAHLNKAILCDPASGKRRSEGNADNDYTSFWVVGLGGDENWYILDIIRDRLRLTERGEAMMQLHRTWRPKFVGYEDYGLQGDIQYIEKLQQDQNYRFKITPLGGNKLRKPDRIKRLVPTFEQKKIYLPTSLVRPNWEGKAVDLVKTFINEEYLKFPVLSHDDMLDCLSRIHDDDFRLAPPSPVEPGYNALREIRRQQRRDRPVV